MSFGAPASLLAALLAGAPAVAQAEERLEQDGLPTYRVVAQGEPSAQLAAQRVLRHLAAGEIDEASQLSNEPVRRREVLRDYLARVGEAEFKRVFAEYLSPRNRVVAEYAIGAHRLIVWDLAEAGHRIAGQYYVQVGSAFLMDDRPSAERSALRRLLERERRLGRRPSG